MQTNNSKFAIKFLPSDAGFAFLMPIVFLFNRLDGNATIFLADGDTGWHIRAGEWIAAHHAVPAQRYLFLLEARGRLVRLGMALDLLFAWLNAHGGLAAVGLVSIILISTVFSLLFSFSASEIERDYCHCVTMVAAVASSIHWLASTAPLTDLLLPMVLLSYAALERV